MTASFQERVGRGVLGLALAGGAGCVETVDTVVVTSSEACVSRDLEITTQAELDALAGCTAIDGSLGLFPSSSPLDLRPLSQLRRIGGQLQIGCYPVSLLDRSCVGISDTAVTSLDGLDALEEVEELRLERLRATSLSPLGQLRRIESLQIAGVQGLLNLEGLEQLPGLEELALVGNPDLESLDGLSRPEALVSVTLGTNPALVDIGALSGVSETLQRVWISDVPVADISPFGALEALEEFSLIGTQVHDLDGFQLRSVEYLDIQENAQLEQVDTLSLLDSFELMNFTGNPRLSRLPSFGVNDFFLLVVSSNSALTQGPSFPALVQSYRASINFNGNDALESIDGFRSLEVVGTFWVVQNRGLRTLDLSSLVTVGELEVLCNPALPADVLEPLAAVQGLVTLGGTASDGCM